MTKKLYIKTFGCQMNEYDSAKMADVLAQAEAIEHTDDPKPVGAQPGLKPDAVLEPGMVVNVDMPFTEIGWGSVHIEDTVVITAGGCDPLTSLDLRLQVVE